MIEKLLRKYRERCGRCKRIAAIVIAATVISLTIRFRDHWGEYISDIMLKLGPVSAVLLSWTNANAAALGVLIGVIGLIANVYFQAKQANKQTEKEEE